MAGDDGPFQVRQHGLAEADDAGKRVLAGAQGGQQVLAHLLLDGPELVPAGAQLAHGGGGAAGLYARWLTSTAGLMSETDS